jgi:hypothetical protein
MREGDHASAWTISETLLAERDPASRDDPQLPYHLRWVWDGRPVDGRSVLVRCYHGLGDTIQFARFLPLLRRRAAELTVEMQPRLIPLFDPEIADRLVPFDPAHPMPPAECDIEIMELAFALRTPPAAMRPPYITARPAVLPPGTVGLCRMAGDWDSDRSIPHALLEPLCGMAECVTLDPEPSPLAVRNPQGAPFDMAETAALVAGVSLVITVDTMIAHLAGAMGKPTWLLLKHDPDWRWSPRTRRSEWYPSMRLYAQPEPGAWEPVIDEVRRDLAKWAEDNQRVARSTACPSVPVSWGELLDKITILEIKEQRLQSDDARRNAVNELRLLRDVAGGILDYADGLLDELRAVNAALWEIEDAIRRCEAARDFGDHFVALARSVYQRNDERAAIKRRLNLALGSELIEEKSYAGEAARTSAQVGR